MVDRVGVGLVSYGSREVAIADALLRSQKYKVELYVADRVRNPFNVKHSRKHAVISDLDPEKVCSFFSEYAGEIDFIVVGPEDPIIKGIRDIGEVKTGIPFICPTKAYALEASKVWQRQLLEQVMPEVNPRFRVFRKEDFDNIDEAKIALWKWLDELGDQAVVKPDGAARGKGVGVWGDHFTSREGLFEHFLSNYQFGSVIVEEKLIGEESSFMGLCDGARLVPLPETRDYKRAFEGDTGPNTGGMGSYKDVYDWLPFMSRHDWELEFNIVQRLFKHLQGKTRNIGLLGLPFYVAFMHTASGPKILEVNSRPGDPEIQNILPILKDDLVDLCFSILDGNLKNVNVEQKATVVIYKVPPTYGGKEPQYSGGRLVNLAKAEALAAVKRDKLRVYPGALELKDDKTYALTSRTVCAVGIGESLEEARALSLDCINAVEG
ncbi:MAG: hypothetical protein QXF26_07570, partial [Candidatus Bathyarchaeia archaeon]